MVSFILSGGIGIVLHYRGKAGFALERNPSLTGTALLKEAILKGTNPPLLAPGTMITLGLLGLAWIYAHSRVVPATSHSTGEES
jgi:hypothetical protein